MSTWTVGKICHCYSLQFISLAICSKVGQRPKEAISDVFQLFWTAGLSAIATHHRLYLTITITICSKVVGQRPKATISDVSTVLDSWTICHCHPLTPSGQRIARRETTSRLPLLYNPFYSIPFNIIWYGMAQGSTNCGARHFI